MSRRYHLVGGLIFALAAQLGAGVLPDEFGSYKRTGKGAVQIADRQVWDEYGFRNAEQGEYAAAGRTARVSVWQLNDTTGAWAALQWLQPGVTQHGNYVLRLEGEVPAPDLAALKAKLPKVDRAANPNLPQFLPADRMVKDSGRYILGPVSLSKFEPRIPAKLVGFDKGAEGQIAHYRTDAGEAKLLLFAYPTPQIARERFRAFEQNAEWKVRRHGPMVAVVLDAEPEVAQKLLASVSYQPKVSWSEHVPKYEGNPGDMLLAICILAGALIAGSVAFGLFFGGLRQVLGSKFGVQAIDDNFTSLHLRDRA